MPGSQLRMQATVSPIEMGAIKHRYPYTALHAQERGVTYAQTIGHTGMILEDYTSQINSLLLLGLLSLDDVLHDLRLFDKEGADDTVG